jgi:hypothetical protein
MLQTNPEELHILEQEIAVSRLKLQRLYDARGYTDSVVLDASIELDKLINQYQKIIIG